MVKMSTEQKDYVLRLLRKQEYDMRTINAFHIRLAQKAKLTAPSAGDQLDAWLDSLDRFDTYDLITQLKKDAT